MTALLDYRLLCGPAGDLVVLLSDCCCSKEPRIPGGRPAPLFSEGATHRRPAPHSPRASVGVRAPARSPPVGGPGHGRKCHIARDEWDKNGSPISLARAAGPSAAKDRYPQKGVICVQIKYKSKSLTFPVGISLNLLLSSALALLAPTLCLPTCSPSVSFLPFHDMPLGTEGFELSARYPLWYRPQQGGWSHVLQCF